MRAALLLVSGLLAAPPLAGQGGPDFEFRRELAQGKRFHLSNVVGDVQVSGGGGRAGGGPPRNKGAGPRSRVPPGPRPGQVFPPPHGGGGWGGGGGGGRGGGGPRGKEAGPPPPLT